MTKNCKIALSQNVEIATISSIEGHMLVSVVILRKYEVLVEFVPEYCPVWYDKRRSVGGLRERGKIGSSTWFIGI
jgi:hypothetical protein